MSFYAAICSNFLFPLHERIKGHDSVALRKRLEESQWWPAEQLEAYRAKRLQQFLVDIGQRVPYYQQLFKQLNFDPNTDRSMDALQLLPVLKEVQGRTTDFVVARDGTVMHGLALIYTVRDLPGVEHFKIEQMSLDQTIVKEVAGPAFGAAEEARIIRDFKARLGETVDIYVERVSDIANESSGKFRYVVSQVRAFGNDKEVKSA
ncbi:MAG TPA: hypothetical protein DCP03_17065 [Polaromonas sp.]|nr:hypothetical protein [Polaromonas sp.]